MSTENPNTSQSQQFVDETLAKAQKSLTNTTYALWIVFTLVIIYLIVLNTILLKSTRTALDIAETVGVTSNNWKTAKGYIEKIPDLKEEKYNKHITKFEEKLKWMDGEKGKNAITKGMDVMKDSKGYLAKVNDPKFFNSVSNQLAKSRNMVNDITQFNVNSYTNQIDQAHMILDLINEAEDTEKIANKIGQVVARELDTQGNIVAQYASELLDENLDTLPEWAKAQVPKYSNRLQDKIEIWINQFCVATSDELGSSFDTFLDDHAEKIKEFSEAADDETALRQLDEELTVMVSTFMRTTPIKDHGTLEEQSQQFLGRLEAANDMLKPLVQNKREDLTPEQQLLRRTLAIFMNKMDNINLEQ